MYALLTVSDTEFGMDARTLGRIFSRSSRPRRPAGRRAGPFDRLSDRRPTRRIPARFQREGPRNKTFGVYLPILLDGSVALAAQPEEEAQQGKRHGPSSSRTRKPSGSSSRKILEDKGYRVLNASNGEAELAKFKEHAEEIALVVSDLVMPYMNGRKDVR